MIGKYFPHRATVVRRVVGMKKDKYGMEVPDIAASVATTETFKCYAKPVAPEEKEHFGITVAERAYLLTTEFGWTGTHSSKVILDGVHYEQVGDPEKHSFSSITKHAKVVIKTTRSVS